MTELAPQTTTKEGRSGWMSARPDLVIAALGCLIVLVSDAQNLTVIPLILKLETAYSLSGTEISWALIAPAIAAAATVSALTRLGDRVGLKNVLLASLVFGTVGNFVSAVAPGFALFVTGRAIMGLSASAIPLTYALARACTDTPERTNRAVGVLTVAIGVGVGTSYLFGGTLIAQGANVRLLFWLLAALSAVAVSMAWRWMPDSEQRDRVKIDYFGALGVGLSLVCVTLGLSEGPTWRWGSARIVSLLILSVVFFLIWVAQELRHENPLVDLRAVTNRRALPAFLVLGLVIGNSTLTNEAESLYLQLPKSVLGFGLSATVLKTAYVLLPFSLAAVIFSPIAGRVISRIGTRIAMLTGAVLLTLTFFAMARWHSEYWQYIVGNAVNGVAFAFLYTPAAAAYLQSARRSQVAMFTSANSVISPALSSVGPTIFAVIVSTEVLPKTAIPTPAAFDHMWIAAGCVGVLICLAAALSRKATYAGD